VEPTLRATLLYGEDNPIDAIVLDVLLRKVRQIKVDTGISVAFAEDSQSILDTITQALLINSDRKISNRYDPQRSLFTYEDFPEAKAAKEAVTRAINAAEQRDKLTRSIFAQHSIPAHELEQDLKEVDDAIGDPAAVEDFLIDVLRRIFGVQVTKHKEPRSYSLITTNLPVQIRTLLTDKLEARISFASPTPKNYTYIGRNHRFVEALCQYITANTLQRIQPKAARASVIRTSDVKVKTTILLFRCRNVIERGKGGHQIVAEEMLMWGWQGSGENRSFMTHEDARKLLMNAKATSNLSEQSIANFLTNELSLLADLEDNFISVAEEQSKPQVKHIVKTLPVFLSE
jgi:hypothetical protein